jgi:hypothetical protein
MCGACLTNQGNRYNSSIPLETLEVPEPSKSIPLEQRSPELINVTKNKGDITDRPHLKNRGQYFVTTPIFYVNGGNSFETQRLNVDPHVGHMHSMIVADVHRRYKQLWRKSTLLSTGTDEYGMKVICP